jgi:hypothetical protein
MFEDEIIGSLGPWAPGYGLALTTGAKPRRIVNLSLTLSFPA